MKAVAIIPARLKSTRLKNKVLKKIFGKPLLWYVWRQAKKAKALDEVIIACCDKKVREDALKFGAEVFWTDPNHKSGTDRIAQVAKRLNCKVVLNVQADEPLIRPETLNRLARFLLKHPSQVMASIAFATSEKKGLKDLNTVKVVVDKKGQALYFSRSPIPFNQKDRQAVKYLKHIGIYGYRKDFLLKFAKMKKGFLEKVEGLEQLRALESGIKIRIIQVNYDTIGVDTEEDFKRVKKIIKT